ncbi:MAG: hypothetical protein AVDCRST_MAG36-296 [uncultured Nocardioidaceae bacterium]|uniref:DUF881 domain-containing protein n=1 Tax=uncultured Nocardioidaceae bacterium TaxID=253824 RepID=A0A6J4L012_9ACTN|nr:MAG: hypothetical protein AVDCRST_MAG36-296 [uncultured Nocardioidaceae bacterium]
MTNPPPPPDDRDRQAAGLLDRLTATSLDEDYAHVAARRDAGAGVRSAPMLVALAVLGLLLTTAAVQAARTASTQERSRESLVAQVQDRRAELLRVRDRLREVRRDITRAAERRATAAAAATELELRTRRIGAVAGTVPVTGPGVRITVDDRPDATNRREVVLDEDLQRLVNGLWVAGAEAVAINGERLTALSAVRGAGEAITVNFRSLRRPYVVEAVGDPAELPARFLESAGGAWWLNLESLYQLRFDMSSEDSVTLPAVPAPALRQVRPPPGGADR